MSIRSACDNQTIHKATPRCANSRGHGPQELSLMSSAEPNGLCRCGCGETLPAGWRYRLGHSASRPLPPRYVVDANGCWTWQRNLNKNGYAMVWRDGHNRLAHRIYFEERHGWCPPTLDHVCRNRACVNPDHLEPCGRGENVRRGDVAKLDWATVAEIRAAARGVSGSQREQARVLAQRFGRPHSTIRGILRDKRWPESERPKAA